MGQLAQMLRAKYPGAYDDLDDATLESQTVAKYPEYADLAEKREPVEAAQPWDLTGPVKPAIVGMLKGATQGAVLAGRAVHAIPGVSAAVDKLYDLAGVKGVDSARDFGERRLSDEITGPPMSAEQRLGLDYKSTTEKLGGAIEQGLEMAAGSGPARAVASRAARFLPRAVARVAPNMAADAVVGAVSASAHGDDPGKAAMLNAAIPAVGAAAGSAAKFLKGEAVDLARRAIKPNVSEIKTWAGASRGGLQKAANRVAQFIVDNRISTPDKAQAIVDDALTEISQLVGKQPTAAPQLADAYLKILARSAAKQGLGADDVATISAASKELINGPMGEQVATSLKLTNPGGKLKIAPGAPVRALRPSVPADEALESARGSTKWSTRRQHGEMKGAATEAEKVVERGQRDAVKVAVPATKPHFARASEAIKARTLLQRKELREGNRDALSMPGQFLAGSGHVIMAAAANLLRSGQLRAGFAADALGNALKANDVQTVSRLLAQLGVSVAADDAPDPMEQALLNRQ